MAVPSRHRSRAIGVSSAHALVTAGLLAALLVPRRADAQLLDRFDPAERGSRFFVADSLELEGDLRFAAGVVTSYGHGLRTFRESGSDPQASDLVADSFWVHPGASLVLAGGARFGIDLPIALQSGNDASLDRTFYVAPGSPRLGDLRLGFDVRVLGDLRTDVDGALLAVGASAYLPTGSVGDYTGDDNTRVVFRVATSVRHGHWLFAGRIGYMYRHGELGTFGGTNLGGEANAVLAAGYRFRTLMVGPELHGSTTFGSFFEKETTPLEGLLGAHLGFGPFLVGAGIGTRIVGGLGSPDFRGVLAIDWAPPVVGEKSDRDHDGVLDADDACPDLPGVATGDPSSRGCPMPPQDRDGDGIFDTDDACPDVPGVRSNDPKTHGCPAPLVPRDDAPVP